MSYDLNKRTGFYYMLLCMVTRPLDSHLNLSEHAMIQQAYKQ